MTPIVYTPHRCTPNEAPDVAALAADELDGVVWQCPDCHAYWEADVVRVAGGWSRVTWDCLGRPSERAFRSELDATLNKAKATAPAASTVVTRVPPYLLAVLDAWRVPGPCPAMHEAAKLEVRRAFPFLAARLDAACARKADQP